MQTTVDAATLWYWLGAVIAFSSFVMSFIRGYRGDRANTLSTISDTLQAMLCLAFAYIIRHW